jgi:hypothetical protein
MDWAWAIQVSMAAIRPTMPLPLIGWKEHVSFPRLKLGPIVAKIDTGARTAALHADMIEVTGRRVRFMIGHKRFAAPLAGHKHVKSSNGISELRPVIRATMQLGNRQFKAEVTLTQRGDMGVPLLLGRTTISGKYLVHPSRSFLLSRKEKHHP